MDRRGGSNARADQPPPGLDWMLRHERIRIRERIPHMAKKTSTTVSKSTTASPVIAAAKAPAAGVASKTPVRNTVIPKAAVAARPAAQARELTYDMIAQRAYEIYCSGAGGSQDDNWHRAERELRQLQGV